MRMHTTEAGLAQSRASVGAKAASVARNEEGWEGFCQKYKKYLFCQIQEIILVLFMFLFIQFWAFFDFHNFGFLDYV